MDAQKKLVLSFKTYDKKGNFKSQEEYTYFPIWKKGVWLHSSTFCEATPSAFNALEAYLNRSEIYEEIFELSIDFILIDKLHELVDEYSGYPKGKCYFIH